MNLINTIGRPLRIFTWQVHGAYLYYLSACPCTIYIPINLKRSEGYYGKGVNFPFGSNVIEVKAEDVSSMEFDIIIFQSNRNFLADQFEILSAQQRMLPKIYIEHNAPDPLPVNSVHVMKNPEVVLVHVTHYNRMMWDNQARSIKVIEHGIPSSETAYSGSVAKGLVICNHLLQRGRIVGADIFREVAKEIPLDFMGMGSAESGGLGEIKHSELPAFVSRYRFVFNPVRHGSLDLSVLEAMSFGVPVVSMATTEYVTVFRNGENGFLDTNPDKLTDYMKLLLNDLQLARNLGRKGRQTVGGRFSLERFTNDWMKLFHSIMHGVKRADYEKDFVY